MGVRKAEIRAGRAFAKCPGGMTRYIHEVEGDIVWYSMIGENGSTPFDVPAAIFDCRFTTILKFAGCRVPVTRAMRRAAREAEDAVRRNRAEVLESIRQSCPDAGLMSPDTGPVGPEVAIDDLDRMIERLEQEIIS
jgi:hypothetical protein